MTLRVYEDFLSYRKKDLSNYAWVARKLDPTVAFKQPLKPSPSYHKEKVLKSPKIQGLLEQLSRQTNTPIDVLEQKVVSILEEIGYTRNYTVIRWLGFVLTKICLKVCSGIFINANGITQLKSKMGACPVIFVPSHRSYADFVMLSYVCFTYGIEIPAITAGMDFHGMWGVGAMLRDTGAFFMRRTYNNDNLYWTTFKEYVYQLVTQGELPIEFFIEGTRSRSNKSASPKYGVISMILKAFFFSQVPDILFVPISLSYDRILEENLFAFELLGVPKPKESTSGFFKSLKILKENYGNIYFHIDQPISAKEFFGHKFDRSSHSVGPLYSQEITDKERSLIPSLAYEIIRKQQQGAVITIFNLTCIILNHRLTQMDNAITKSELLNEISWLKCTLEAFGAYIDCKNLEESFEKDLEVHKNLMELNKDDTIGLVSNKIVLNNVNPLKLKAHTLSEETMTYSVPFIMLQIYINPALCFLIDAAFIVVVLRTTGASLNRDELFQRYSFLRSIFSIEFVSCGDWERKDFEKGLSVLVEQELIKKSTNDRYEMFKNEKLEGILFTCIQPFILTYYMACCVLEKLPDTCFEKDILTNIQDVVEKRLNDKNGFIHPYCLNLDSLTNCLSSLTNVKVLKKSRNENKMCYEINREDVGKIRYQLGQFIRFVPDVQHGDIKLRLKNKL